MLSTEFSLAADVTVGGAPEGLVSGIVGGTTLWVSAGMGGGVAAFGGAGAGVSYFGIMPAFIYRVRSFSLRSSSRGNNFWILCRRSMALERMLYCKKISACSMKSSSTVGSFSLGVREASSSASLWADALTLTAAVKRLAMARWRLASILPFNISRRFWWPGS